MRNQDCDLVSREKRTALGALGNAFTSRSTFLGENCSLARPLCEAAPLDRPRRSEPSRRWLLRLRTCPFELLNRPAKPIEHGFLNVRCGAPPPEGRHRISAPVQRN